MIYKRISNGKYKYELGDDEEFDSINIWERAYVAGNWVDLSPGCLRFRKGYQWDGPSGPTIDSHAFIMGSLIHDGLYQLIREGKLDKRYRYEADREMYYANLYYGMSRFRATYTYWAVRIFGRFAV